MSRRLRVVLWLQAATLAVPVAFVAISLIRYPPTSWTEGHPFDALGVTMVVVLFFAPSLLIAAWYAWRVAVLNRADPFWLLASDAYALFTTYGIAKLYGFYPEVFVVLGPIIVATAVAVAFTIEAGVRAFLAARGQPSPVRHSSAR